MAAADELSGHRGGNLAYPGQDQDDRPALQVTLPGRHSRDGLGPGQIECERGRLYVEGRKHGKGAPIGGHVTEF